MFTRSSVAFHIGIAAYLVSMLFLYLIVSKNLPTDQRINISIRRHNSRKERLNPGRNASLNDLNQKHHYLKKYPFFLECTKDNKAWRPFGVPHQRSKSVFDTYSYTRSASNKLTDLRITRAVAVYFPAESFAHFALEIKWLYRSWVFMQQYEPIKWRTDLVVFIDFASLVPPLDAFWHELNCTAKNRRQSDFDPPMCVLIDYRPLKSRKIKPDLTNSTVNKLEKDYLLNDLNIFSVDTDHLIPFYNFLIKRVNFYPNLDSVLIAFDGYDYFSSAKYDFVLRTDMDVFLTPLFAKWAPRYCNDFYSGGGAYTTDFNDKRMRRVARELDLEYANVWNIGSSWISTPRQLRIAGYLSVLMMAYLAKEEFTAPEQQGKIGVTNWPDWHFGVLSMYGAHMALNHLSGSNEINLMVLPELIDYPTGNNESVYKKVHIHVFHGDDLFSKFAFKMGHYDNMTIEETNVEYVKYYALKMALEAKRFMNNKLYELFNIEKARKA